jgi:hypothetical protein
MNRDRERSTTWRQEVDRAMASQQKAKASPAAAVVDFADKARLRSPKITQTDQRIIAQLLAKYPDEILVAAIRAQESMARRRGAEPRWKEGNLIALWTCVTVRMEIRPYFSVGRICEYLAAELARHMPDTAIASRTLQGLWKRASRLIESNAAARRWAEESLNQVRPIIKQQSSLGKDFIVFPALWNRQPGPQPLSCVYILTRTSAKSLPFNPE